MNTKLILVEGIQGSGKSTIAQKISDYLKPQNQAVTLYAEGQPHPADLAWNACVPMGELDGLLLKYKNIEPQIKNNMRVEGGNAIIAYTLVETEEYSFYQDFEKYEVYNNKVPPNAFRELHYSRWQAFGAQANKENTLNIFESAFLQNHVSELMNFQLAGQEEIEMHLNRLLAPVLCLSPVLIYLSPANVEETIERVAQEREFIYGKWIDALIDHTENCPYGKKYNLKGRQGVLQNIENRKKMELEIIERLPIQTVVFENNNFDWGKLWNDIQDFLQRL